MIDKTKCGWCGQQVQPGTEHEPAGACEDCTVKPLGSGLEVRPATKNNQQIGEEYQKRLDSIKPYVVGEDLNAWQDLHNAPAKHSGSTVLGYRLCNDNACWCAFLDEGKRFWASNPQRFWTDTPQENKLCPYHEDSLGWDHCTEGFTGCAAEKNNPGGGSSAGVAPSVQYSAYECNSRIPRVVLVDVDAVRLGNGSVNRPVADLVLLLERYCVLSGMYDGVVFMSRMSESYREETVKWLVKHNLYHGDLYMRAVGDNRGDWLVKLGLYRKHIHGKYSVAFSVDVGSTIGVWRAVGITCLVVV